MNWFVFALTLAGIEAVAIIIYLFIRMAEWLENRFGARVSISVTTTLVALSVSTIIGVLSP